jgi:predicted homoserine dehydrogenase-like protein
MTVLPAVSLAQELRERADAGRPVRVALIGCGKFGTMFLAQARRLDGLEVTTAIDLDLDKARSAFARAGWAASDIDAPTPSAALATGRTFLTTTLDDVLGVDEIDLVIEATGLPRVGTRHALGAIDAGKHVVLVNVEADVLVGPELARRAADRGVHCSMAYGDQPAMICELVDWARACGFEVVCAGKGTKYLPLYHSVNPDGVWEHYGFSPEEVATGDYNAKMFTSFLDGTKAAIEMAAVANATGLLPPEHGLAFPPAGVDRLADVCRPAGHGGVLERTPTVEVVSSLERDGSPVVRDLRWGVFVTFTAEDAYTRRCLAEYGAALDDRGEYASLYRPNHFIGLELAVSVLSVALHDRPTGATRAFSADVVAVAKRDLRPGEVLDGEGGYCVWGRAEPAATSVRERRVPIGLADRVELVRPIAAGAALTWDDVSAPERDATVELRAAMVPA